MTVKNIRPKKHTFADCKVIQITVTENKYKNQLNLQISSNPVHVLSIGFPHYTIYVCQELTV